MIRETNTSTGLQDFSMKGAFRTHKVYHIATPAGKISMVNLNENRSCGKTDLEPYSDGVRCGIGELRHVDWL